MSVQISEKQAVKVGDVFYTSWGYDQTNVEFFKVVRATASSVWVQETGQEISRNDAGRDYWYTSSNGEPLVREERIWEQPGEYKTVIAPVTIHRIKHHGNGEPYIRIKDYKNGYFWDGKPKLASTGH